MSSCTHLETITVLELPESVDGCEECLRDGGVRLHLRICHQPDQGGAGASPAYNRAACVRATGRAAIDTAGAGRVRLSPRYGLVTLISFVMPATPYSLDTSS
jgi:hypothetical protein